MAVEIVLTEVQSHVTPEHTRRYARLRERVEAAAAQDVSFSSYQEVDPQRLLRAGSIVLSGSWAPWDEHDPCDLDRLGAALLAAGRPVLGICAGMQLQARFAGGAIGSAATPERGFLPVRVHDRSDLFGALPAEIVVFHDHGDEVTAVPDGFRVLASSDDCAVQAIGDSARRWWGTQFHPEEFAPEHPAGEQLLRTFFALAT